MLILLLGRAFAATLIVDSSGAAGTYDTIGAAIGAAASGDTIEVAPGAWYECVVVDVSVSIVGTGGSGVTEMGGGGYCESTLEISANRVEITGFTVTNPGERAIDASGNELTLADLIVEDAGAADTTSGGGLRFTGNSLEISDSEWADNEAAECGGIYVGPGAEGVVSDSKFLDNVAYTGRGGALCLDSNASAPTLFSMSNVVFQDNEAEGAGAVELGDSAELVVVTGEWSNNHANDDADEGGAILVGKNATLSLSSVDFSGNGSGASRSGMNGDDISAIEDGATLFIEDSAFSRPDTYGSAGEIYLEGNASLRVERTTFSGSYMAIYSASDENAVEMQDCTVSGATNATISIRGEFSDEGSTFSDASRGIEVRGAATLSNSAFRNFTSGSFTLYEGSLSASGLVVEDSVGLSVVEASGTVVIEDSTFTNTANSDGGAVSVETGDLAVSNTVVTGASAKNGGAFYVMFGDLTLSGVTVTDSSAWAGGAAGIGPYEGNHLVVQNSWFEANESTYGGGGALFADGVPVSVNNSVFVDNSTDSASQGGAIAAGTLAPIEITDSVFCGNQARYGGAIAASDHESFVLTNVVLAENSATGDGGAVWANDGAIEWSNITVAGNEADEGGGAYLDGQTGTINNAIFAYTVGGDGLAGDNGSGDDVVVTYTDWFSNAAADISSEFSFPTTGFGNTTDDPGFLEVNLDGNCWNDNWNLNPSSAIEDAGDPSVLDNDGTRSDMGATGGGADWADNDGDDWLAPWDCNDSDSTVGGESEEIPYDGKDQDCDGSDLVDVDNDGFDATEAGGTDCDDNNNAIYPGATDIPGDGVDQDCDGSDAVEPEDTASEPDSGGSDSGVADTGVDSGEVEPVDSADSANEPAPSDSGSPPAGPTPGCAGEDSAETGCAGIAWLAFVGLGVAAGLRRRRLS